MIQRFVFLILLVALTGSVQAGGKAIAFDLPDLKSGRVRFDPQKLAKPVILAFWMSHCPYCIREFPHTIRFYSKNRSRVEMIGISLDDAAQPAKALVKKTPFNYPNAWDGEFKVADAYRVNATPTYILIGKNGAILKRADRIEELEGTGN